MEIVALCSYELGVGFGLAGVKNMLTNDIESAIQKINLDKNIALVFLSKDFKHLQNKLQKPSIVIEDIQ